MVHHREFDSPFNELLEQLEKARVADEELHRRGASLAERTESHDRLMSLRAALAEMRKVAAQDLPVTGLHDSRVRRGTLLD